MKHMFTIQDQNPETIPSKFDEIATKLFQDHFLKIGEKQYFFTEIEFYLNSKTHPDKFTHPHQMGPGQWRAHYSGIDITLESTSGGWGGILIRGIRPIDDEERFIDGPLKVSLELLSNMGEVTRPVPFKLDTLSSTREGEIYKHTRIGLKPKENFTKEENAFIDKPYRYLVERDHPKHKYPNKTKFKEESVLVKSLQ